MLSYPLARVASDANKLGNAPEVGCKTKSSRCPRRKKREVKVSSGSPSQSPVVSVDITRNRIKIVITGAIYTADEVNSIVQNAEDAQYRAVYRKKEKKVLAEHRANFVRASLPPTEPAPEVVQSMPTLPVKPVPAEPTVVVAQSMPNMHVSLPKIDFHPDVVQKYSQQINPVAFCARRLLMGARSRDCPGCKARALDAYVYLSNKIGMTYASINELGKVKWENYVDKNILTAPDDYAKVCGKFKFDGYARLQGSERFNKLLYLEIDPGFPGNLLRNPDRFVSRHSSCPYTAMPFYSTVFVEDNIDYYDSDY